MRSILAVVTVLVLWAGKLLPGLSASPSGGRAALAGYVVLLLAWLAVLVRLPAAGMATELGAWRGRWLALGVGAGLVLFAVSGVGYAVSQGPLGLRPPAEAGLGTGELGLRTLLLLGMSLAAAVLEEWVFRGVLLDALGGAPAWVAVVGSAVVFAVYHLSPFQLLPIFLLGVGLAAVVLHQGALWPAVVAHACFNAVGMAVSVAAGGMAPGGS